MGAQAVRLSNVDIDNALKNKDFEVLFQPVFDLGNGALARVETFVRWRHPKLGLLPPGAFISFFETQGRMSELTRYVLAYALKAYMDWRGPWPPGLSVNLALSDLSDDAFTSHFTKLLRDHDFPADLVTLECPMPPVDMPIETAQAHFERLGETGARLAIEVRGRANELLRSLDPFPFDEIKTGGSAILRFARTVRGPGLSAIADLLDVANEANAAITAVGVEDQASLAALRGLGFTAAQGNHLGKVGDLKEFRPHRINEVRALLELEPLSQENLTALFRTEAPAVSGAKREEQAEPAAENQNALIDRLNERVAQFDGAPETGASASSESDPEEEKKAKAREKAKALALAKRAKARAERKNAAIDRAKAKAAGKPVDTIIETPEINALGIDAPFSDAATQAPRDMQERLNRAFTAGDKADDTLDNVQTAETTGDNAAPAESPKAGPDVSPAADSSRGTPIIVNRSELAPQKADIESESDSSPKPARASQPVQSKAAPSKPAPSEAPASGPSLIERAMAQQPPISKAAKPAARQTSPTSTSYAVGGMSKPISMAVGRSNAYFQPGIHVGAPALLGEPDKPEPQNELKIQKPAPAAAPAAPAAKTPKPEQSAAPTASLSDPALSAPASEDKPASAPTPQPASETTTEMAPAAASGDADQALGDLHQDISVTDEAAPTSRQRKPFLKRTIVPLSGYFWPQSWRRAWRRRAEARETAREQREEALAARENEAAQEAAPQSAETTDQKIQAAE